MISKPFEEGHSKGLFLLLAGFDCENLLKEMAAEYNFDNGPELEIAICTVLRAIRP